MARVTWHEDARLDVDGVRFLVSAIPLTTEEHLIIKSPQLVRRYLDLLETERPRRIVELGVRDGGSTALDSEWLTVRRGDDEVPADEFRLGEPWYDVLGYLR